VFAVVVKLAAFFALFNVYNQFLTVMHVHSSLLLYISSMASMLLGALGTIRVINEGGNRRQFVAYTSINQVGFVRLGLVCFSSEGFIASFVYLIVYLLASLLFLGILSRVRVGDKGEQTLTRLDQLRWLFNSDLKFSRRTDLLILAYAV
jgi:NADH:ubiquinone oxidoreductase subunit 2 (subunit N)